MPTSSVLLNTATQGFHSNPRQRMRKMSCASFIHLHSQVFQSHPQHRAHGPVNHLTLQLSEHRADRKIPPTSGSESSSASKRGATVNQMAPRTLTSARAGPHSRPRSALIWLVILRLHFWAFHSLVTTTSQVSPGFNLPKTKQR